MANIHDCLQTAVDKGGLDEVRRDQALSEYQQLVDRFSQMLPPAQAQAEALRALRDATKEKNVARRHKVIAQLQTMVRLQAQIMQAKKPARVLKLLLEYDDLAASAGFTGESVRSVQDALIETVHAGIQDALRKTGRTITGRQRDPALLRQIVQELHGQSSGNALAKELADAVGAQQERLRKLFNAHGGNIGKLDRYGLAHSHNADRILLAGLDAWKARITPLLDWSRITDLQTGKPFSASGAVPPASQTDVFLRQVFDNITTGGWIDRDPSLTPGGRALYSQHAEHRVLHFKDGDGWMDYNTDFGLSNPFDAMIGGLHAMARDVALMRVLGPNPKASLEFASQLVMKRAMTEVFGPARLKAKANASWHTFKAKAMLSELDGSTSVPESIAMASFMSGVRGVSTSAQLGSALLSSPTDLVSITMGAKVSGLNPGHMLAQATKMLVDTGDQKLAANLGYVAETLSEMGAAGARMGLDSMAPEVINRLTNFTMRASLLSYWTDMLRMSVKLEFSSKMGLNAHLPFDQIDPDLRRVLAQREITAADWDALRAEDVLHRPRRGPNGGPPLDGNDPTFISATVFLNKTTMPRAEAEGLGIRLQMVIAEQVEIMMPSRSTEISGIVKQGTRPGTILGEAARSFLQYKNYPLAFTLYQARRIASLGPSGLRGIATKAGYAALGVVLLTIIGGFNVQTKEAAKGRDPRPMNDPKFWMAAFMQGGGAGIFGDFFFSNTSRTGGGLAEAIAGPAVGLASDVAVPFGSNAMRMIQGKDTTLGRDAANFVRYNTPVLSSLWYARTAFDRIVADNLQLLLDPDANAQWRAQAAKLEREMGTQSFWLRGQMLPTRAPDISNIARQQ